MQSNIKKVSNFVLSSPAIRKNKVPGCCSVLFWHGLKIVENSLPWRSLGIFGKPHERSWNVLPYRGARKLHQENFTATGILQNSKKYPKNSNLHLAISCLTVSVPRTPEKSSCSVVLLFRLIKVAITHWIRCVEGITPFWKWKLVCNSVFWVSSLSWTAISGEMKWLRSCATF